MRQIHAMLEPERGTGYTTVLKLLQSMLDKGLVCRDERSRSSNVYESVVGRDEIQRALVEDLIDRAFRGSIASLLMRALSGHQIHFKMQHVGRQPEEFSLKSVPVWLGLFLFACSSHAPSAPVHAAEQTTAPSELESASATSHRDVPRVRVALTFDDLGASPVSVEPDLSRRILATLAQYDAPSAVFANCKELDLTVLDLWLEAGAEVGNHTATHPAIEDLSPADWRREVVSCDKTLRAATGQDLRYFRYPFLRYGETEERRDSAKGLLQELGYRVAHVSAATSEWLLSQYYDRALALDDEQLQDDLVAAYVEHMVETIEAARTMALDKVGRDIAHITLLHVNELAGSHLDQVLDEFERRGYELISLSEALQDPAYKEPDEYAGRCGCSWLARISPPLRSGGPYVFGQKQREISALFGPRVEEAELEHQGAR